MASMQAWLKSDPGQTPDHGLASLLAGEALLAPGEIGILLNAIICALDDASDGEAGRLKRLVSLTSATLRKVNRPIEEWGR